MSLCPLCALCASVVNLSSLKVQARLRTGAFVMVAVAVPQGPKGGRVMGNMREFNRDTLGFIERCGREFGDVVLTRFLYVPAYFLFNPEHIEYVLATGSKNFV